MWGKVRNSVASSKAAYQASAGDLETMRLSMRAELATNYFQARALDAQAKLLDETVAAFERALSLTRCAASGGHRLGRRRRAGADAARNHARPAHRPRRAARAARTRDRRADRRGARELHAARPCRSLGRRRPSVPVGIPSTLLERRPDVAAAERRMRAANANIGVAKAAYFPSITLSGSGGFESVSLAQWLSWPSAFWSLGVAVSQTVFDGGARRARSRRTRRRTTRRSRRTVRPC